MKMKERRDESSERVVDGSDNVFSDLGLPSTERDMLKVQIARAITNTLQRRGLTQVAAAKVIGADQAKISALCRGRLKGFGVERLFGYLVMLGRDVDIRISRRHRNRPGKIRVTAA